MEATSKSLTFLLALVLVLLIIVVLNSTVENLNINSLLPSMDQKTKINDSPVTIEEFIKLLPAINTSATACDRLLVSRNVDKQFTTDFLNYMVRLEEHNNFFRRILAAGDYEGFSAEQFTEIVIQFYLAKIPFVKTICETGFNAGHSALLWLSTKPGLKLYAFDLGAHKHARTMATRLNATFPGQLTVTWGSSKDTLPVFSKTFPEVKCDLVVVDGGHSYEIAKADFEFFRPMAKKRHILYMGDTPCVSSWCIGPNKLWSEKLKYKHAESYAKCSTLGALRGYSIGVYGKNST